MGLLGKIALVIFLIIGIVIGSTGVFAQGPPCPPNCPTDNCGDWLNVSILNPEHHTEESAIEEFPANRLESHTQKVRLSYQFNTSAPETDVTINITYDSELVLNRLLQITTPAASNITGVTHTIDINLPLDDTLYNISYQFKNATGSNVCVISHTIETDVLDIAPLVPGFLIFFGLLMISFVLFGALAKTTAMTYLGYGMAFLTFTLGTGVMKVIALEWVKSPNVDVIMSAAMRTSQMVFYAFLAFMLVYIIITLINRTSDKKSDFEEEF